MIPPHWSLSDWLLFIDTTFLSSETAGGFTGVYLALYVSSLMEDGYADFDWFDYHDNAESLKVYMSFSK